MIIILKVQISCLLLLSKVVAASTKEEAILMVLKNRDALFSTPLRRSSSLSQIFSCHLIASSKRSSSITISDNFINGGSLGESPSSIGQKNSLILYHSFFNQ